MRSFCVHFAILPQVNHCLEEFTDNHSLSSGNNITPEALFTIGLLEKEQNNSSAGERDLPNDGNLSSVSLAPHGMEDVTIVDVPDSDYHSAIKGYIDKKRMAFPL